MSQFGCGEISCCNRCWSNGRTVAAAKISRRRGEMYGFRLSASTVVHYIAHNCLGGLGVNRVGDFKEI